jgi:hypothetical protein
VPGGHGAACAGADPAIWFPNIGDERAAKAICTPAPFSWLPGLGTAARLARAVMGAMAEEVVLSDGWPSVGGAVLIDGQVHRSSGPWTPAVHDLLCFLEANGFDGSPRVLGFDHRGREVLSWIDGEAPLAPWPQWMQSDEVLADLGSLLRRYHDTVAAYTPPMSAAWRVWLGSPGGPIIRHGDLWPSNVVFRHEQPVVLID